jgi:hypothetical protein
VGWALILEFGFFTALKLEADSGPGISVGRRTYLKYIRRKYEIYGKVAFSTQLEFIRSNSSLDKSS